MHKLYFRFYEEVKLLFLNLTDYLESCGACIPAKEYAMGGSVRTPDSLRQLT